MGIESERACDDVIVGEDGTLHQLAVSIRSGVKSYKAKRRVRVFEGLDLSVPTGKIYGLLGPSGCGKTSIIRCILGQVKLDRGTLRVFGHPPGTPKSGVPGPLIGYMPQETALFETMTIGECFWYYGTMVGMSGEEIKRKSEYFRDLLKLPPANKVTSHLSGGQGRRVSFAIAILHEPKLVILDEPTVGIDPILKDCVWKHLIHLAATSSVTIIVTTHYIEEARAAHRVGFLHGGSMTEEDWTERLMQKYSCTTLEMVYWKVCNVTQKTSVMDPNQPASHPETGNSGTTVPDVSLASLETGALACGSSVSTKEVFGTQEAASPISPEKWCPRQKVLLSLCLREFRMRWNPTKSIIIKNFLFLLRFPGAIAVILFLPSIVMLLTYITQLKHIHPLAVSVVNEDAGHLAHDYLSLLSPDVVQLSSLTSLTSAKQALLDHLVYGTIHIHHNFSAFLNERLSFGLLASSEVVRSKVLTIAVDDIQFPIQKRLLFHLFNEFGNFLQFWSNHSTQFELPIQFNDAIYSDIESPSLETASYNAYCCAIFFSSMASTFLSLFVELRKGSLERTFVAGVSSMEVVLGLLSTQFPVMFVQNMITIILLYILYPYLLGSWIPVFLLFCNISLTGLMLGIFFSVMISQIYALLIFGAMYTIASGCINAAVNPVEAMPYAFQYFCKGTPMFFAVHAFLDIVQRGFGCLHQTVILGFLTSFSWAVGLFLLSMVQLIAIKSCK